MRRKLFSNKFLILWTNFKFEFDRLKYGPNSTKCQWNDEQWDRGKIFLSTKYVCTYAYTHIHTYVHMYSRYM